MAHVLTVKDSYAENRLFLNRVVVAFAGIILLILVLSLRLIYLQVVGHDHYATLSQHNRVKISPIVPTRGLIFDRNGKVLAQNQPTYSLELIPEQVPNMETALTELQILINLDDEEIQRFQNIRRRSKPFVSIPLRLRLSDEEVARFAVQRPHFQGVDIHARLVRNYPYSNLTSHIVGYVGRINIKELQQLDAAKYQGTHHVGKTGIENFYEHALHGETGYQETETNAQGRSIHALGKTPPSPGADLRLTLDIELQKTAHDMLGDYNGAIVAIEVQTGEVLVFISKPGFDPNPFVYGISHENYQALETSPDQPLFNRALRGQYPPGSTIKPFVALAGLEYGVTDENNKIHCPGFYRLPNLSHRYRDWKRFGHGLIDMKQAITQSCDVYFYGLAHNLGIDRMYAFLSQFGFGKKIGIDINGEKSGLLPSSQWKQNALDQVWFPGETLITGIGQGFTQTTPLQLANATAIIARRGESIQPHLVKSIHSLASTRTVEPMQSKILTIQDHSWDKIIDAMVNVVHGLRGTARRIGKDIPYKIAGKTGTAQVFTVKQEEEYDKKSIEKKLQDHALFVAFAPADNPTIAISVVVENGGHGGSVAAPIAGVIIDQYLSKTL